MSQISVHINFPYFSIVLHSMTSCHVFIFPLLSNVPYVVTYVCMCISVYAYTLYF